MDRYSQNRPKMRTGVRHRGPVGALKGGEKGKGVVGDGQDGGEKGNARLGATGSGGARR